MSNFRFWATLITASILGVLGLILGGAFVLPAPFDANTTRVAYGLTGILIGFITFARLSTWVVKTVSRLSKQVVTRLASEIINQFSKAAARGLRVIPAWEDRGAAVQNNNLDLARVGGAGAIILDTSSIIDGRVLDVAKTGFLSGAVLIPGFVLTELRLVSDSADPVKRARGRRGFEIIDRLKKINEVKIEVWDEKDSFSHKELLKGGVDDKIVRLGKILRARVLTCDFNLNREAKAHGVCVLNLNELTNALKTLPVPGEKMAIRVIHPGKDKDQGVGYCGDGTMVIIKDAAALIGEEIQVEVTKILQSPSGRMIFGKVGN